MNDHQRMIELTFENSQNAGGKTRLARVSQFRQGTFASGLHPFRAWRDDCPALSY